MGGKILSILDSFISKLPWEWRRTALDHYCLSQEKKLSPETGINLAYTDQKRKPWIIWRKTESGLFQSAFHYYKKVPEILERLLFGGYSSFFMLEPRTVQRNGLRNIQHPQPGSKKEREIKGRVQDTFHSGAVP